MKWSQLRPKPKAILLVVVGLPLLITAATLLNESEEKLIAADRQKQIQYHAEFVQECLDAGFNASQIGVMEHYLVKKGPR